MKWYVLTSEPGKETKVKDQLEIKKIPALVPREKQLIRRKGLWHEEIKILFPGYVFICCDYTRELYYKLKAIPGVQKILNSAHNPEPLTPAESEYLLMLCPDDDPLQISKAVKQGDNIVIVSGLLKGFEANIIKINLRQKRATIAIQFMGREKHITLSLNLIKKSICERGVDSSSPGAWDVTDEMIVDIEY